MPSKNGFNGLVADAAVVCGASCASYAMRPASTAILKATAICTGSCVTAIAVLTSTADAPISIASAACDGAPIPASTTTGTLLCSMMILSRSRVFSPRFDRGAQRHDAGRAYLFEPFAQYRVGVDVRHHDEAVFYELFGRGQRFDRVGQQVARIGMDFEFDPVRPERFARHLRGENRFFGIAYPRCVRQQVDSRQVQVTEHVVLRVFEFYSFQRDGYQFAAAGGGGFAHQFRG